MTRGPSRRASSSKAHLAGTGTSAGGILIGRAITERPDLFAAAVCNVGVANAMRVEFSPDGPVNTPEFGTVADPAEAAALYERDAVDHVQAGTKYPAVLGVAPGRRGTRSSSLVGERARSWSRRRMRTHVERDVDVVEGQG